MGHKGTQDIGSRDYKLIIHRAYSRFLSFYYPRVSLYQSSLRCLRTLPTMMPRRTHKVLPNSSRMLDPNAYWVP
jgi:hypothetical protein